MKLLLIRSLKMILCGLLCPVVGVILILLGLLYIPFIPLMVLIGSLMDSCEPSKFEQNLMMFVDLYLKRKQ